MTDLGIGPGNAFQTRQKVVVSRLREAILRGSFAPGERLDQKEISERLKVSRSPVREALRTLAAEGLVEVIPHRGAVVAELSPDELEEIVAIRSVLEGMAARLAVTPELRVRLAADQSVPVALVMHKRGLSMGCHLVGRTATSWRLRSWS